MKAAKKLLLECVALEKRQAELVPKLIATARRVLDNPNVDLDERLLFAILSSDYSDAKTLTDREVLEILKECAIVTRSHGGNGSNERAEVC